MYRSRRKYYTADIIIASNIRLIITRCILFCVPRYSLIRFRKKEKTENFSRDILLRAGNARLLYSRDISNGRTYLSCTKTKIHASVYLNLNKQQMFPDKHVASPEVILDYRKIILEYIFYSHVYSRVSHPIDRFCTFARLHPRSYGIVALPSRESDLPSGIRHTYPSI